MSKDERMTYRSLKRAWIGFKIAKKEGNHEHEQNEILCRRHTEVSKTTRSRSL